MYNMKSKRESIVATFPRILFPQFQLTGIRIFAFCLSENWGLLVDNQVIDFTSNTV